MNNSVLRSWAMARSILVALCLLAVMAAASVTEVSAQTRARIAVLSEEGFPAVDGVSMADKDVRQALAGYQVRFLSASSLVSELDLNKFDLLITPYGSAFPKEIGTVLLTYLRAGGHWINLGGTPLSVPVRRRDKVWVKEPRQVQFHKLLGITQSFPVPGSAAASTVANTGLEETTDLLQQFSANEVYELYVRFTSTKDFPGEDGTAGQRDAILRPLVWNLDKEGWKVSAPLICIDRLEGEFAGGRWVLANFNGALTTQGLRTLVRIALEPAGQLAVRPSFACYRDGEIPTFSISLRHPGAEGIPDKKVALTVTTGSGSEVVRVDTVLTGDGAIATAEITPPLAHALPPGLYTVQVEQTGPGTNGILKATNGFWVYDKALMAGGQPFTAGGTYLMRDGKPYPVTGTTYMASDVARKFLLEPNPAQWNTDFAAMKKAGINMVRTGLWTAWKNLMLDVGTPNEAALRSLDAFVLTARKYDIPVIFTFFAFLPETWGGVNAYLDPRSVSAQRQFLSLIAQRYGMVNDLIWDLINEPSFCNPDALWSCRPNYDSFERSAWKNWLDAKYSPAVLQEAWRLAPDEAFSLPTFNDFADVNIFDDRRPFKVIDYRLFAQDMFRRWIGEMTTALRSNGNPNQLITVGQDEAGTNDSPNNQFMGDDLGFTSVHNWWANDDLVWDNIVTTVPGIPNLVEETGVMFYEKMDGSAWRTEEEAANLLERKLGISIGAGGAGFVEWIWNINPFMKSDNEATIGLFRVDGTLKPECARVRQYAGFFNRNRQWMEGKQDADVLLVLPHSNMFSTRNSATEATRQSVRALSYYLNIPVQAVSEYRLDGLKRRPPVLIVPSPGMFKQSAWESLLKFAREGSTVVISGPFDADEHRLPIDRSARLGIKASVRPVTEEEPVDIGGRTVVARYRNLKIQRLEKSILDAGAQVVVRNIGKGRIIWSPLPLESADNIEPTVAFYQFALRAANVSSPCSCSTGTPSIAVLPLVFKNAVLYTFISETDRDVATTLTHRASGTTINVTVPAQRTVLLFVERATGRIIDRF